EDGAAAAAGPPPASCPGVDRELASRCGVTPAQPPQAAPMLAALTRWATDQAGLLFGLAVFLTTAVLLLRDWRRQRPAAARTSVCFACDRPPPPGPHSTDPH